MSGRHRRAGIHRPSANIGPVARRHSSPMPLHTGLRIAAVVRRRRFPAIRPVAFTIGGPYGKLP